MKQKILYTCEYCNVDYANKIDAEKCESNHKTNFKIASKRYLPYKSDKSGLPISITIEFENGNREIYKR